MRSQTTSQNTRKNTSIEKSIPSTETLPKTADAAVIGGGIGGVATAFWLSRGGLDTVLVA